MMSQGRFEKFAMVVCRNEVCALPVMEQRSKGRRGCWAWWAEIGGKFAPQLPHCRYKNFKNTIIKYGVDKSSCCVHFVREVCSWRCNRKGLCVDLHYAIFCALLLPVSSIYYKVSLY